MRVNILLSSAGRRVALLQCLRDSLAELGLTGQIIAIDSSPLSAAAQLADRYYVVPRCTDPEYLSEVLTICEAEEIRLLIPTIDTELPAYAQAAPRFRQAGVHLAISSPETVTLCCDKALMHPWLVERGFPAPRQASPTEVISRAADWQFPVFVKPADGSASVGSGLARSVAELELLSSLRPNLLVQERLEGLEHTVNVFVSTERRVLCAIPHARLETRAGEVSKGLTVRNQAIIECATRLAETLPGAYGAINIQCFLTPSGQIRIIEANARFGGGYPLAHHANARMIQWLIEDSLGRPPSQPFTDWTDGLLMLRYDEAVYVPQNALEVNRCEPLLRRVRS